MDMREYVCHYKLSRTATARAVYHADNLAEAMGAHNAVLPEYSTVVLKWVGPEGITYHMHDSKIEL
jgi:hypothetical protein